MRTPPLLVTALAAAVFAVSVMRAVKLHAARLTGCTPAGFLAYLEMAGWVVLVLASGTALLRIGPATLWISTGAAGAALVLAGRLRRGPTHG
ncbi:MAG: hypothetical protein A2Z07_05460 [Armatimonadetes bacterium RBG_16_67_12]|nr:MAG: hypothetical protein A2Z07_05460 [Armatimonadetes bacterium RBG_16_67_12]